MFRLLMSVARAPSGRCCCVAQPGFAQPREAAALLRIEIGSFEDFGIDIMILDGSFIPDDWP
jgi:hypothetical protein